MAVYWSRGFGRNMAGLAWLDDVGKEGEDEEGVMNEEDGMVAKEGEEEEEERGEEGEGGERWLCWIRSGRWCARPVKPFFSGPQAGTMPNGRLASPALWKREKGTRGLQRASKGVGGSVGVSGGVRGERSGDILLTFPLALKCKL